MHGNHWRIRLQASGYGKPCRTTAVDDSALPVLGPCIKDRNREGLAVVLRSRKPSVNIDSVDGDASAPTCLCGPQCRRLEGSRALSHGMAHNDLGHIRRTTIRRVRRSPAVPTST